MLHGLGRQQIAKALGIYLQKKGQGDGSPVPISTVDGYIARVKLRWKENPMLAVEDEREQAVRRYKKRIIQATRHVDAARYEELLVKVTGLQSSSLELTTPPVGAPGSPVVSVVTEARDPATMTSQERRREIAALEARRAAALSAASAVAEIKQEPTVGQDARPEGPEQDDPDPA